MNNVEILSTTVLHCNVDDDCGLFKFNPVKGESDTFDMSLHITCDSSLKRPDAIEHRCECKYVK